MQVEQAVTTFIDRVNDLLAVLNAERGNRLTRTEYLRWMVPISQAWEVIFEHASQVPDTDLDSLVSGTETDRNRALQLLHQIVCNELPMAALAGEVSMVVLPRYNEQELSRIFVDMLDRMQVVAKLLRSDSHSNGIQKLEQQKVIVPEDEAVSEVHNLLQKDGDELSVSAACREIAGKRNLKATSLRTLYYRWKNKSGL